MTGFPPASGTPLDPAMRPKRIILWACLWTGSRPQGNPGLLLLHAAGNVFVRELGQGETILIKPRSLIFKDPTVQMHLHFEDAGSVQSSFLLFSMPVMSRHMWLRLIGPGRVAVQSVFHRHDDIFGNLDQHIGSNAAELVLV